MEQEPTLKENELGDKSKNEALEVTPDPIPPTGQATEKNESPTPNEGYEPSGKSKLPPPS